MPVGLTDQIGGCAVLSGKPLSLIVSQDMERITFVSDELDQGKRVTDYLVAHVTTNTACQHTIAASFFSVMQEAGVRRMVCPSCGVRCTLPPSRASGEISDD